MNDLGSIVDAVDIEKIAHQGTTTDSKPACTRVREELHMLLFFVNRSTVTTRHQVHLVEANV